MGKTKRQRSSRPRFLFGEWRKVAERIRRAERLALFLDFDGTLVGFKKNPAAVQLDGSTRRLLDRLARNRRVHLVIISGRRRQDLRRRVSVVGASYIGLHGFETGPRARLNARSRRQMERVGGRLRDGIRSLPGVWVEDKRASVALHFRGAPVAAAARARAAAERLLKREGVPWRVLRGKRTWEFLAPEVPGKGRAVADALSALGGGALAVYVGDDATDETAFEALAGAVTVRVGCGARTLAHYCVRSRGDVRVFLGRLNAVVSGGKAKAEHRQSLVSQDE